MKIIAFFLLLIIDQVTKLLASQHLELGQPIKIIPGLFDLTLVHNPGVAFGMLGDLPDGTRQLVLFGISIVAVLVIIHLALTEAKDDLISLYAIMAILSGAVGNFIDRVRYHYVVDFFDFYLGDHHWPAFNVADSAISVGVCILLIRLTFFVDKREGKNRLRS